MSHASFLTPERGDAGVGTYPMMRFGTFALALDDVGPFWEGAMLRRFRACPHVCPGVPADAVLRVHRRPEARPDPPEGDVLHVDRSGATVRVRCDLMTLDLDLACHPVPAALTIHADDWSDTDLEHCFAVFVQKLLLVCGIVRLHGAAIEFAGRTHVFLGDKGAGKSTTALALGRAGGRVLADDQIVVRRRDGQVVVSGCDDNIRLTAEAERHFLSEPLDAAPQDFAGTLKKEVSLHGLVAAIPHQDRQATRLYFPRVGARLHAHPIGRREAVVRILNAIAPSHSFAGPTDRWDLVRLVTDFVAPLECLDLELSPDLSDLDRLVDVLRP